MVSPSQKTVSGSVPPNRRGREAVVWTQSGGLCVQARAVERGGERHPGDGVQALADAIWGIVWPWGVGPWLLLLLTPAFGQNFRFFAAAEKFLARYLGGRYEEAPDA